MKKNKPRDLLRPCPICGGKATFPDKLTEGSGYWRISCATTDLMNCDMIQRDHCVVAWGKTVKEVTLVWNRDAEALKVYENPSSL